MIRMAEVLEAHPEPEIDHGHWYCTCGHDYGVDFTNAGLAAHQAAALSAAGFGSVVDAKAEALEEAAELIEAQRDDTNPDRTPDEGWSVVDHRAGRFLGKTVAARVLRARADEMKATRA